MVLLGVLRALPVRGGPRHTAAPWAQDVQGRCRAEQRVVPFGKAPSHILLGGSTGGGGRPARPWGLGLWERWALRADGPSGSGVRGQPAGLWVFPAAQAPSVVSRGLWVPTTEVRESGGGREAPPQLLGAQWGSRGRERWPWPAGGGWAAAQWGQAEARESGWPCPHTLAGSVGFIRGPLPTLKTVVSQRPSET